MTRASSTRASTRRRAAPLALISLASILLAFALPSSARAEDTRVLSTALAALSVNGQELGDVEFYLDQDGQPLILAGMLRTVVGELAKPEAIAILGYGDGLVSAQELEAAGILLRFEAESLQLSLIVEPRSMRAVDITAANARQAVKGEARLKPEPFSAALGLDVDLEPSLLSGESGMDFAFAFGMRLDPVIYFLGFVASAEANLSYSKALSLGLEAASLIKDFPSLGARMVAGLINSSAVGFQSSDEVLGLAFYRESGISIDRLGRKQTLREIVLDHSASVTIEMNGSVIKQLRLDPGSYELSDLSLSSGLNDLTIRIEEEGREARVIKMGIPFDPSILDPGELDYRPLSGRG